MNTLLISLILTVVGADSQFRLLTYVVDRPVFEAMVEHLDLNEDQRTVAELFWREYLDEALALDSASIERRNEAGADRIREIEREARLRGERADPDSEEMGRLYRATAAISADAHRRGDVLVQSFLTELASILHEPHQMQRAESLPRLIRRVRSIEVRRRSSPGSNDRLNSGIQLQMLIEDLARSHDREQPSFYRWLVEGDEVGVELSAEDQRAFEAELARILDEYDMMIDPFRVRAMQRARRVPGAQQTFVVKGDSDWGRELWQTQTAYLDAAFNTNQRIAQLIERSFDPAARERWLDRFYPAIMPMFGEERVPDWTMRWLSGVEEALPPGVADQLRALYEQYQQAGERRRARILQTARAAWPNYVGMLERGEEFSPSVQTFLRALWSWRLEIEQFEQRFHDALPPDFRPLYVNALSMAKSHQTRLRGPAFGIDEYEFASGLEANGWMPPRINPETGQYIGEWKHSSEYRRRNVDNEEDDQQ